VIEARVARRSSGHDWSLETSMQLGRGRSRRYRNAFSPRAMTWRANGRLRAADRVQFLAKQQSCEGDRS
jgi:hypothetical protein